ncbi:hypothetical protein BJ166DRAFT_532905, partial [Pestalotiopsis sp. NC0098]
MLLGNIHTLLQHWMVSCSLFYVFLLLAVKLSQSVATGFGHAMQARFVSRCSATLRFLVVSMSSMHGICQRWAPIEIFFFEGSPRWSLSGVCCRSRTKSWLSSVAAYSYPVTSDIAPGGELPYRDVFNRSS